MAGFDGWREKSESGENGSSPLPFDELRAAAGEVGGG